VTTAFGGQDAVVLTNAPVAVTATVVPEPALPEVTVPKPAQIDIPSATAIPSGPVLPVAHPLPVMPPTSQSLLSKSMQSGPGGPKERLASIAAPPPSVAVTNAVTPGVGVSSPTNAPAGQSNIWQKSTPSLNGVDYHW
jgi:hypothetical protein